MASSFDALPPEIVQKCVEFLDFDLVSGHLKGVSKATRGAARNALTRGRWRTIRYVAEQGLAVCTPLRPPLSVRAGWRPEDVDPPPPAAPATFREAWALDPALVIKVICDWDTNRIGLDSEYSSSERQLFRMMGTTGYYQARFLSIVEPSADGLSHVISASEGTYLIQRIGPGVKWPFFPFSTFNSLAKERDPQMYHRDAWPLIGIGLEDWADPILAARFTHQYFCFNLMAWRTEFLAETWSDRWEDRAKARVFMAEIDRLIPPPDPDEDVWEDY